MTREVYCLRLTTYQFTMQTLSGWSWYGVPIICISITDPVQQSGWYSLDYRKSGMLFAEIITCLKREFRKFCDQQPGEWLKI